MTSVITMTRSSLQASISIAGGQLWPLSARGGVLLGAPYEDDDSGSTISSSVVAERRSSFEGDKSTSYVIPDDATADILSAI